MSSNTPVTPTTAAEAKQLGNDALKAGNADQAIAYFTQAILLLGDSKEGLHVLHSNRAAAFMSKGDYESALKDADRAIELQPDWPRGYGRRAAALHGMKDYERAIPAYKEALKHDPDNQTLRENMESLQREWYEKDMSDEGIPTDPERPELPHWINKVFGPEMMDRLRENPETAPLMQDPSFVATMRDIQEHPERMEEHLEEPRVMMAVQVLMGFTPHIRDILARRQADVDRERIERENKEREEARKKAEEEARKKEEEEKARRPPEQVEADNEKEKGNVAYKAKDFDTALACYQKAAELYPNDATYLLNTAAAYLEKGDYDKCAEVCKDGAAKAQKLAQYPLIPKFYTRMGNAYMKKQDYASAVSAYKQSLLEDRNADTLKKLSKAEKMQKEAEIRAYIDPEKAEEAKKQGNEFFKQGLYPEAVKAYTEAIKRSPSDPIMYSNRAAAYTKLLEYPSALKDCDKALELNPRFIKGYTRKGACHFFMKEYHKAIEAYSRGLDIDPDNQDCKDGIAAVESKVAEQQNREQADPEQLERAMQDPEVRSILNDPIIAAVIQDFNDNPLEAQHHLENPEIRAKINKLVESGVLRVSKRPVDSTGRVY